MSTLYSSSVNETENFLFAANLVHDLRGSLSGIKLIAAVLKENAPTTNDQRLLQNIVDTTNNLSKFIDHILKMSKESDVKKTLSRFPLSQLVIEVIDIISISAEAKNLTIYVNQKSN